MRCAQAAVKLVMPLSLARCSALTTPDMALPTNKKPITWTSPQPAVRRRLPVVATVAALCLTGSTPCLASGDIFQSVTTPDVSSAAGPATSADAASNTPATSTSAVAEPPAAPGFPAPTDQPPPEVPTPRPMHVGTTATVGGALDARYRINDDNQAYGPYLYAGEIDVTYPLVHDGVTHGNVVLQAIGEDPPDIHDGSDVEFGEAYVIYKLPIPQDTDTTAYVKVGQFQIPFGLLAVYDPHLQISQPLYSQSLGVRNDWGIAVSGRFYSILNYDFSITRGVGPNVIGQVDPTQVVNFRLGRTFNTRNGIINVGGSLLTGRLPATDLTADHPFAVELPPSGRVRAYDGYVNKTRIAADGTLLFKRITARGEAVEGADNDSRVLGYYAIGEYMVSGRFGAVVARWYWQYRSSNTYSSSNQIGATYLISPNVTSRVLYEGLLDRPSSEASTIRHRLTFQMLFRF